MSPMLLTKRGAFLYKIILRAIQNTRNFYHSRSERFACFETTPSSEVFEEFSGKFLYSVVKKVTYFGIFYLRRFTHLPIGLSALI